MLLDFFKGTPTANILKHMGGKTVSRGNNKETTDKIYDQFINGKINYFLMPEGTKVWQINKPLQQRFQKGISKFILKVAKYFSVEGKTVNVVPIGLDYSAWNKKQRFSIFLGEPVKFKQTKNDLEVLKNNGVVKSIGLTSENAVDTVSDVLINEMAQAKQAAKLQRKKA